MPDPRSLPAAVCPCGAEGPCANPNCHVRTGIAPGGGLLPPQFVRVHLTRRVPSIHLVWFRPFEGEKRLTTLCGHTRLVRMDDSTERICATCERMAGDRG